MMPPSPRLSARRIRITYFSVTTTISAQKITDTAPTMLGASSGTPCAAVKTSFMRVQRAGADVAVDDAERAEGEDGEALLGERLFHDIDTGVARLATTTAFLRPGA